MLGGSGFGTGKGGKGEREKGTVKGNGKREREKGTRGTGVAAWNGWLEKGEGRGGGVWLTFEEVYLKCRRVHHQKGNKKERGKERNQRKWRSQMKKEEGP